MSSIMPSGPEYLVSTLRPPWLMPVLDLVTALMSDLGSELFSLSFDSVSAASSTWNPM
jgi:hypothetical protein